MRTHTTPMLAAAFLAVAASALATPTGLNNIPTADTVPHRTVATQAFSSFGGANQFAANLRVLIDGLMSRGLSQRAMVAELNKLGIKAPRGGNWSLVQLQRLLGRLDATPAAV